jgi:hypothetical protein
VYTTRCVGVELLIRVVLIVVQLQSSSSYYLQIRGKCAFFDQLGNSCKYSYFLHALFENAILKPSTCVAGLITCRTLIFNGCSGDAEGIRCVYQDAYIVVDAILQVDSGGLHARLGHVTSQLQTTTDTPLCI